MYQDFHDFWTHFEKYFQAENSTFHAEHKIWRRPKYICCKQCHSCNPTLHLLSRMLYSSPSQNTSILLRLLLNTVNMLQEPVSRDFNHMPSAPSAELGSSCLFLLLFSAIFCNLLQSSAIWQHGLWLSQECHHKSRKCDDAFSSCPCAFCCVSYDTVLAKPRMHLRTCSMVHHMQDKVISATRLTAIGS
jgi:hypothetical protein